ncbi:hypothetical protein QFC24_005750 [Naganishia onofrii]|uniref:Uncharacterized protein n=1 Tax=Naganishia onofrii TaxID=1851511 RepID=A0ACC2X7F5_9TREE|nr:hypothetical protein QFC24_005750 [Naganishia onofrii]
MALLEDADNYDRFLEVHLNIQDQWATTPYDKTTSLLFACNPDLRQTIITHLVHLYSHSTPVLDRYAVVQEVLELSKDAATRSMFILRSVVQLLAQHSVHPWTATLNPWQSHLIQHYERLAPFPLSASSEEEVIEEIWGREWPLVIQLRTRSRHHKIYELATWCRTLGINLTQLATDLRPHLTEEGIVQMFAVNLMRQQYQHLSNKILRLATSQGGIESLDRPKMVELISWDQLGQRNQPAAFLFRRPSHLNRGSAAFEEMFPPSGLRKCNEAEYLEREAQFVSFGEDDDRRSSPELTIMPNTKPGPSRTVDIKPKIPTENIIDLSGLTDSEPSSPQRHPKYWSPPPSRSPSPASLEIVKTHGWTALAVIKKEPELEQNWDSEDEVEEVSRNQHSQSTDGVLSALIGISGELDADIKSTSPETQPVRESSTCPNPRSPNPRDLHLPLANSPTTHMDSNDGEIDQIDVEPASLSAVSERKPDTPGTPVNRSPVLPLDLPPPFPTPAVASIESKDSQKASKRTADAMLSGTPEAESAKRVKEAEEPATPLSETIQALLPESPLSTAATDTQNPNDTEQAQLEDDEDGGAEEVKRFERAWTVDSEVWADILRSDSDAEADDVKPVIPQEPLNTGLVQHLNGEEPYLEDERAESGEKEALQEERAGSHHRLTDIPRFENLTDTENVKQIVQELRPSENPSLKVPALVVADETAEHSRPQAVRGLHRANVAIDVVRRQLTKVHVGSQLYLRIGRNGKGSYDVHQDVREETRNLASIRATPEIHADITQFFETIASSLLDYASTLEIGEEISLKITRASFDRYEWSTNVQEIGANDSAVRQDVSQGS